MIIQVGNIGLQLDILGNTSLELEREIRNTFSGFNSQSAAWDASLKIFVLPEIHLDSILLDEETAALKHMLERMEKRFPYAKFPYEWVTGVHRNGSNNARRPKTLPRPFISSSHMDRFSVVPLRQCLLALNHDDRQAFALVRGRDISVLNSAVTIAVQATLCMLAPGKKSVILHGASVEMGGEGYLFVGVSGSGKSTLAKCFPSENVFSDESTLCYMAHGTPYLAPTPFIQTENGHRRLEPTPLSKIFFLNKDNGNSMTDVSPGAAMARILHNHIHLFSFFRNEEAVGAFHMVDGMVRSAPASILNFTRTFDPLPFFEETAYEKQKTL
ncbi:MAG: hypothetical protein JRJ82_12695 [Deltaproteobacteria bacterium]|nr:hypothetical protein [Deltaproteobacteria bacterium]